MKSPRLGFLDQLEQKNEWVTYSRTKRVGGAIGLWTWSCLLLAAAVLIGKHESAPRSWYVLCATLFLFFTSFFLQLGLRPRGALKRAMIVMYLLALLAIPLIALA